MDEINKTPTDCPKVTVGVTNYNAQKYLSECLDSIVNQSYKNVEIIIVDDKSNDKSIDLLNKYQKKYKNITLICHEKNSGSPDLGRREIIEKANGDYFMLFDSDDLFKDDNSLEKLVRTAVKNIDIDYVYCNMEVITDKGTAVENWVFEQCDRNEVVKRTFAGFGSGVIPMKGLFKRKFFVDNNISYLSNGTAGDTLTSILCMRKGMKIKFVNDELICYRQHSDNLTFNVEKRIKSVINVEEYIINNFDETIYFPEIDWSKYDTSLKESIKYYVIGRICFRELNMYYEGKWMPWINRTVINDDEMLIYMKEAKKFMVKYLTLSRLYSPIFARKIFNIFETVGKIYGTRIIFDKDIKRKMDLKRRLND